MRAPPDSMKPTTGAPARPASRSTRHDRVGVLLAERAAEVGRVLRVAEDRPAVDAAGAGDHAVAGARLLAHAARAHVRAQQRAASRGRRAPRGARAGDRRSLRCVRISLDASCGLQAQHGVVAAEAERVRQRDGGLAVDVQRAGLVRARSRGPGPRRAPRSPSVGGATRSRRARMRRDGLDGAGGAEQVPDRRLRRGDRDSCACSPSAALIAIVSARSLSGVEVPWALT